MFSDQDKQKLRDHWQREITTPRADEIIQSHPDGRKKSVREILERALNEPDAAEAHFKVIARGIEMGFHKDVDDYIRQREQDSAQPAP
jgi:hypothetical protein